MTDLGEMNEKNAEPTNFPQCTYKLSTMGFGEAL